MNARAAWGVVLIALAIPAMSQTTVTINELRQKMDNARAAYQGDDPAGFAESLESAISALQAQYGDHVPLVAVVKALHNLPAEGKKAAPAPPDPNAAARQPDGITVEQTLAGFHLRAVNKSYGTALIWLVFVGALAAVPFRAFPDLIREIIHGEGTTLWLGGAFLAAYAALVLCFAWTGAVGAFGEVRITRAGENGAIFWGIGSIGRKWEIHWSEFHGAADQNVGYLTSGGNTRRDYYVALTGSPKRVRFGNNLSDAQRAFIVMYLQEQVFGSPAPR